MHSVPDFAVSVPEWLATEIGRLPARMDSPDNLMRLLNGYASRNVAEGTGGPFAAAVINSEPKELVAVGVNLVLRSKLSFAHAEMVALSLAQRRLGAWNLRADGVARSLVVNAQPCAMCTGAVAWSGVSALDFGAAGPAVEALTGFDEGPVSPGWRSELERRGITVTAGRLAQEAEAVLRDFGLQVANGSATVYNGQTGQDVGKSRQGNTSGN